MIATESTEGTIILPVINHKNHEILQDYHKTSNHRIENIFCSLTSCILASSRENPCNLMVIFRKYYTLCSRSPLWQQMEMKQSMTELKRFNRLAVGKRIELKQEETALYEQMVKKGKEER